MISRPRAVVHFVDSDEFGGTEQMLLTLLSELDRGQWRPILAHHDTPGAGQLAERAQCLGIDTRPVPSMRGRRGAQGALRFARMLTAERATVFHAHLNWPLACSWGLFAARLARVPAIIATQQLFVAIRSRRNLLRHKLISTTVDRYIAVSRDMAEQLSSACLFVDHKVAMIHNATPVRCPRPTPRPELRAAWGAMGRPIVLSVARLDRQKGLPYLLSAMPLLPTALLVIAGEGKERARLQSQARALRINDRVIFLGYHHNVPDLIATSDVVALPSLYEGLPVTVLEAMAAEKPVVATAIPGTDEAVVHGETGFLVPPMNPEALARAIRLVLDDPVLATTLGKAGRARAEKLFSAEAMARSVSRIYDEVLGKRKERRGER